MASDSERILTDTSIWLVRLERGLQPREGEQLRAWLQVPAQRNAIVDAAKLYHGPDIVAVLAQLVPVGFGNPPPPLPVRKAPAVALLALIIALTVAIVPLLYSNHKMPGILTHNGPIPVAQLPLGREVYTTGLAQTRIVTLPDGSRVTLNGHSRLGIVYGPFIRTATLDYGEGVFNISREPKRPFEITAGGRRFQAPPSTFDVRVIGSSHVVLTVLDGDVNVQGLPWRWPTTPAEARLFDPRVFTDTTVGPMQAAELEDTSMSRYPISAANIHQQLSWQPEEVIYVNP